MPPRHYSGFWLAFAYGLISLSPCFAARDAPEPSHPTDDMPMADWLRLPERQRSALVQQYAHRRPTVRYVSTEERRNQAA